MAQVHAVNAGELVPDFFRSTYHSKRADEVASKGYRITSEFMADVRDKIFQSHEEAPTAVEQERIRLYEEYMTSHIAEDEIVPFFLAHSYRMRLLPKFILKKNGVGKVTREARSEHAKQLANELALTKFLLGGVQNEKGVVGFPQSVELPALDIGEWMFYSALA